MRSASDPQLVSRGLDERAASAFVALVWLACVVVLALWLARFVSRWPWNDDITMSPFLAPHTVIDWTSYWVPHNEHRIPLAKLAFVALLETTHDLRAGAWAHWVVLSSLSFALLWALRRRTGRSHASDALIPIALLQPGNFENLLSTFQLAFLLPTAIGGALLVAAVGFPRQLGAFGLGLVWSALVALLLCGSVGWVLACALAPWPLLAGALAWRRRDARGRRWPALAITAAGALLLGFLALAYVRGLPGLSGASSPDLQRVAHVTAEFLTCGLAAASSVYWPWTGWIVLASLAVALGCGVRALRDPVHVPLVILFVAGLAVALSIGYGRGQDGIGAGFVNRYVMLSASVYCTAQCCWRVLGRGVPARVAELVLFTAVAACWTHGFDQANAFGKGRLITDKRLERAIESGAGVAELARDNWRGYYYGEQDFADYVELWRRAGFFAEVVPGERVEAERDPLAVLLVEPVRVDAAAPRVRVFRDGAALVVRDRIEVELAVPDDAERVSVRFAVDAAGRGDVLDATIESLDAAGARRVCAAAHLSPRSNVADTGWRKLEGALDGSGGASRRVVLRFSRREPGPAPVWILVRGIRFELAR